MVARFHIQQDKDKNPHGCYQVAFDELTAGQKKSCWIWWIFPQLKSALPEPHSATSEEYGLRDLNEAYDYLNDPTLFNHYNTLACLVLTKLKDGVPALTLMGKAIDVKKLISSLVLFREIAADLAKTSFLAQYAKLSETCNAILEMVQAQNAPEYQRTVNAIIAEKGAIQERDRSIEKKEPLQKFGHNPIEKALISELDDYIRQRAEEPSHWYQGLFKGYSKKEKLKAAITLRLALTNESNEEITQIAKAQGLNMAQLATRNCLDDLPILRQGRLGVCLRAFAETHEFGMEQKTVRNLVKHIQAQRVIMTNFKNII